MRKNEPIMSSMFCGITHTSKLLSDMRKMRERNSRTGKAVSGMRRRGYCDRNFGQCDSYWRRTGNKYKQYHINIQRGGVSESGYDKDYTRTDLFAGRTGESEDRLRAGGNRLRR